MTEGIVVQVVMIVHDPDQIQEEGITLVIEMEEGIMLKRLITAVLTVENLGTGNFLRIFYFFV